MLITIAHYQTKEEKSWGIFTAKTVPRFGVRCTIKFSADELASIQQHKLQNLVVDTFTLSERAWSGDPDFAPSDEEFSLQRIIKQGGWQKTFASPGKAQQWEKLLREKVLPNLKAAIAGGAPTSNTFEL